MQRMIGDSAQRVFADNVSKELLERFEADQWCGDLWDLVAASGFALAVVPESAGGIGGTWWDAYPILRGLGYWNVPLPLAETMLAGALLAQAGVSIPEGPITVIEQGRLSQLTIRSAGAGSGARFVDGRASGVPWARRCRWAVLSMREAGQAGLALVDLARAATVSIEANDNLAKEPRDAVRFDRAPCVAYAPLAAELPAEPIWVLGALVRSMMIVGALESVLDQSVRYANDRIQFGRPIGKYQAIQQNLAVLAAEVGAARMAASVAALAAPAGSTRFDVAVAKVRAGEAATRAPAIAHQVHGAIGFTYEHSLHFATRRLWSWRGDFGAATGWARELGEAAIHAGAKGFWPALTGRALLKSDVFE